MTREHAGRGPLSRDEMAQLVARDIPAGAYVNLGIGQPTRVADYLDPAQVWLASAASTPGTRPSRSLRTV